MATKCLLEEPYCNFKCENCGWNLKEHKRRQKMIADKKFFIRWDGVKILILPKEKTEE